MSNAQGFPVLRAIEQFFRRRSLRRATLLVVLCLGLGAVAFAWFRPQSPGSSTSPVVSAISQTRVLRIGYQKAAHILYLLKSQQVLEKRLEPEGTKVEWTEFTAGPPMVEALNTGSIHLAYIGETPPIFAQAAGVPLVYVGYTPIGGAAEAILVPGDSPIQTVADLKGKKVAFNKGSNVQYLLVKALEEVGLQYSDIEPAFMPPAEAGPAFAQGSVAAWVIWDPFMAEAEKSMGARILRDGVGLVNNYAFYVANQKFTQENPDLVRILVEELDKMSKWAKSNRGYTVDFLSAELGIDKVALEQMELRHYYGVQLISDDVVASQQQIADTYYKMGLIDKEIKIAHAIWR